MRTPNDPTPTPAATPMSRTDLVSPGLRGMAEKVLLGSGGLKRSLCFDGVLVVVAVGAFFTYPLFRAYDVQGDLQAEVALIIAIMGGQVAQSLFPRDWRRAPYLGYTIVNAVEFAGILASITFLVTVPMTRTDTALVLVYAVLAALTMHTGFLITTRMRRLAAMDAETPKIGLDAFEAPPRTPGD